MEKIIECEVKVNEIIWGNTKMDIINGYDSIAYTTLKLNCTSYTIMVFKENFKYFQDIKVGDQLKVVLSLWKNNVYNFIRLIEDHPKLLLAKQEQKNSNFEHSKFFYEEYFSTFDFLHKKKLPIGIIYDIQMYIDVLTNHYKLNISSSNPYYEKFNQTLEKCYDYMGNNSYRLKKGIEKIHSINLYGILHHGKYEKVAMIDILKTDPEYLFSLIIETDYFCLTEICFIISNFEKIPNYKMALEINCIKRLLEKESWDSICEDDNFPKNTEDFGGFNSWEDMSFGQAFEGDSEAYNNHYQ